MGSLAGKGQNPQPLNRRLRHPTDRVEATLLNYANGIVQLEQKQLCPTLTGLPASPSSPLLPCSASTNRWVECLTASRAWVSKVQSLALASKNLVRNLPSLHPMPKSCYTVGIIRSLWSTRGTSASTWIGSTLPIPLNAH